MASNPYDDVLKRSAIMDQLGQSPKTLGQQPGMNTTMPVPNPNKMPANPSLSSPSPVNTTMPVGGGRRDQWSLPSSISNRGDFGRLTGFNADSFGNDQEQSFKNQMGRVLSRYDPRSPNAIQQIAADPDFISSGYRIEGTDKIVGPDGYPVDILRNADVGGAGDAWAWQTSNPADQGSAVPASAAPVASAGGGSNLASIMQEIQALSNGTESPSKRRAVLDLLMDPSAQQAI